MGALSFTTHRFFPEIRYIFVGVFSVDWLGIAESVCGKIFLRIWVVLDLIS